MADAPRNGNEAASFLKRQHDTGANWRAMCLSLQRNARGLPAVYPSALSAQRATPVSERVNRIADLKRGMVAYSDDPSDSNPWGHIYFIIGRKSRKVSRSDPSNILCWSNDVVAGKSGAVGVVALTFFRANWGDGFQFGATWLNGYDFAEFDKAPKPVANRGTLSKNYEHAIEDVEREIRRIRGTGHPRILELLESDLTRMKQRYASLK